MIVTCHKCGGDLNRIGPNRVQSYCTKCHAGYMRNWRKTHPLTPEQRLKDRARSIAAVYKKRGKIKEAPCEVCGMKAEMHHDDYGKPLSVRWLCRFHHLEHHKAQKAVA